jgi:hypothetical protein
MKLTTPLYLVPRSKNAWGYITTPPIRLHGVVLSLAQGQLHLIFTFNNTIHYINREIKRANIPRSTILKVKVKFSLCLNLAPSHEGVLGSGGTALSILDLGTRWR